MARQHARSAINPTQAELSVGAITQGEAAVWGARRMGHDAAHAGARRAVRMGDMRPCAEYLRLLLRHRRQRRGYLMGDCEENARGGPCAGRRERHGLREGRCVQHGCGVGHPAREDRHGRLRSGLDRHRHLATAAPGCEPPLGGHQLVYHRYGHGRTPHRHCERDIGRLCDPSRVYEHLRRWRPH